MSRFERSGSAPEFDRQHDQLLRRYHEALDSLVNGHDQATGQIAQAHDQALDQWTQNIPDKKPESKFEKILDSPGAQLTSVTRDTARSADSLFDASSKDFERILSPADRQHLAQDKEEISFYGPNSMTVRSTLSKASSRNAQSAMQAAIDKLVWQKVQEEAGFYGPSSMTVRSTLGSASCRQAESAMKAALDKQIWEKVQEEAGFYGPGSMTLKSTLGSASSRQAQSAMQAALDKLVWQKVKEDAGFYGVGSMTTRTALGAASSRKAQNAMSGLLGEPERQEPFSSSSSSYTYDMPNFEDILRGFRDGTFGAGTRGPRTGGRPRGGGRQQQSGGQRQHQAPPRTHETPRPRQDDEIEHIIRAAVSNGRGERWLLTEDRAHIRKVVNTVKAARAKAQEAGEEIKDRDIYIRYRRLVDQAEGEAKKEDLLRSFQILQALMGGSPSGKLPF